jgi:hypothetical protein
MGQLFLDECLQKVANFIRDNTQETNLIPRSQLGEKLGEINFIENQEDIFVKTLKNTCRLVIDTTYNNFDKLKNKNKIITLVDMKTRTGSNGIFYKIRTSKNIKNIEFDVLESIPYNGLLDSQAKALVIRTPFVCTVSSVSTIQKLNIPRVYVPETLVGSYKIATNWSSYTGEILPLSEYKEES